jgi:antitoxin Phd
MCLDSLDMELVMEHIWQVQEAKNKFSEVINDAVSEGPQIITRHGQQIVVVLAYDEYTRLIEPKTDLVEFFQNSPLAKVELNLERDRSFDRDESKL